MAYRRASLIQTNQPPKKSGMKKTIISATIISLCVINGAGVPARRGTYTVQQPDGTTLTLRKTGDERMHFILTDDDKLVIEDNDGRYCYARVTTAGDILSTGITARDAAQRTVAQENLTTDYATLDLRKLLDTRSKVSTPHVRASEPKAPQQKNRKTNRKKAAQNTDTYPQKGMGRFTTAYPTRGKIKGLVILVEYSDVKFNTAYATSPHDYFNDLLNKENFSEYGGTGSAAQFFRENSMGLFDPDFTLVGPVTLPNTRSYYGANDSRGDDMRPAQMVADACRLIDDEVNFADFDNDGDGILDNVFVFYAGQGEASYGPAESIWPHAWELSSAGLSLVLDGVRVDSYACTNEWQQINPDGIGTFVHEFSHVMGLPDLYNTNGSGSWTPGEYSVMDYGPYNNDSRTPPAYSAYERNAMGWLDPIIATGPSSVSLDDIKDSNSCVLISTGKDTEFFLFENRQKKGWDEFIPGHGMLIWHIDYVQRIFDANRVNNTSTHSYVDIVEAGGVTGTSEYIRQGYTWPGRMARTEFTAETAPAFCDWSGNAIDLPVTEITEEDGIVSFNIAGGSFLPPLAIDPVTQGANYFMAAWNPVDGATDYLLSVYGSNTLKPAFDEIVDFSLETGSSIPVLPTGWSTDVTDFSTRTDTYGEASPSLCFNADGQSITSRVYDSDLTTLSFWTRCRGTLYFTSTINVEGLINGQWTQISAYSPGLTQQTIDVSLPEGTRAIRLSFVKGAGNVFVDDIRLHSDGVNDIPLEGYQRVSTAGATAMRVDTDGLEYDLYRYTVRSTDGKSTSPKSNDIYVSMSAGIDDILADDITEKLSVTATGTQLSIHTAPDVQYARIYDSAGALVTTVRLSDGLGTATVPGTGFYIVRAGSEAVKTAIKQ